MRKILTLLIICLTTVSCETESPYSGYSVFFTCDASFHPFNQASSYGQFITVRRKTSTTYEVTDAQGITHTKYLTESEARQKFYYGLGGLIIGTPSLEDGRIWAYDLACPNCDMARYRLQIDNVGLATCPNCECVYDLNCGGIPIEGKSRILWRYRVHTAGTFITVQN